MQAQLKIFGHSVHIAKTCEPLVTMHDIYMKVSEAIQLVKDTRDELIKAKAEILGKIANLENADGELTEEQAAAVTDLRATAQGLDDIVPDDPPAPGSATHTEDPPAATGDGAAKVPLSTGDEAAAKEETGDGGEAK